MHHLLLILLIRLCFGVSAITCLSVCLSVFIINPKQMNASFMNCVRQRKGSYQRNK